MKILVTGATSLIGKEVISLLLEGGHEIRTLTRQKNIPAILGKTDVWTNDLADLPIEIASGMDAVIHIAAATPDANSTAEDYRKTNIDGTKKLLLICKHNKVKRFIYISSVVVLFEEYNDNYTLSKKAAEAMIIESNLNWTILRPSEILGSDKSWNKFLSLLKMKKIVFIPGNGKALVKLRSAKGNYLLAAGQNRGPLKIFELKRHVKFIPLHPEDISAEIKYNNGKIQKREFYYGSSFLSQSGRFLNVDTAIKAIKITNNKGEARQLNTIK